MADQEIIRDVVMRLGARAEASVSSTFGSMGGMFQGLAGQAFGFNQILAAAKEIVGQVAQALENLSKPWEQAEVAQTKYANALRLAGAATKEMVAGMAEGASAYAETTTKSNDAIKQLQGLLLTYGATIGQLDRCTQATLDFAAATGIEVTHAARLVGRAAQGMDEGLARYGIRIEEGTDKSKVFEKVMEQMSARFGGSAAAELDTYAGRMANLNNQLNEQKEIGGASGLAGMWRELKLQWAEAALAYEKLKNVIFGGVPEGQYSKDTKAWLAEEKAKQIQAELDAKKAAAEAEKIMLAELKMIADSHFESQVEHIKRRAAMEEDQLKKQIDLVKDITKLERERTEDANKRAQEMGKQWALMSAGERNTFGRLSAQVEAGGWTGMNVKQRETYLRGPGGEARAEELGLFTKEITAEMLARAGGTKSQIEAKVLHEVQVKLDESGDEFSKSLAEQIKNKALPEIKKMLNDLADKTSLLLGEDQRNARQMEAGMAKTAGGS